MALEAIEQRDQSNGIGLIGSPRSTRIDFNWFANLTC